jgi:hypothetical protein
MRAIALMAQTFLTERSDRAHQTTVSDTKLQLKMLLNRLKGYRLWQESFKAPFD